jgi:hypothetical protein
MNNEHDHLFDDINFTPSPTPHMGNNAQTIHDILGVSPPIVPIVKKRKHCSNSSDCMHTKRKRKHYKRRTSRRHYRKRK